MDTSKRVSNEFHMVRGAGSRRAYVCVVSSPCSEQKRGSEMNESFRTHISAVDFQLLRQYWAILVRYGRVGAGGMGKSQGRSYLFFRIMKGGK